MSTNNSVDDLVDCGNSPLPFTDSIGTSSNPLPISQTGANTPANTSTPEDVSYSNLTPSGKAQSTSSVGRSSISSITACTASVATSVAKSSAVSSTASVAVLDAEVVNDLSTMGSFDGHDDGFTDQIPAKAEVVEIDVSTPVGKSPSKADLCPDLQKKRSARKGDGVAL